MRTALFLAYMLLAAVGYAQTPATTPAPTPAAPAPYTADTESPDALIAALYGVISGPVGQARDWDRFRNLFHPKGHLMAVAPNKDGVYQAYYLTPDDYIARSGPRLVELGFHEVELARTTDSYGPIVQVFTTYQAFAGSPSGERIARGINSVQLVEEQGRWWILSIAWHGETPTTPLPEKYLKH